MRSGGFVGREDEGDRSVQITGVSHADDVPGEIAERHRADKRGVGHPDGGLCEVEQDVIDIQTSSCQLDLMELREARRRGHVDVVDLNQDPFKWRERATSIDRILEGQEYWRR